MAKICFITVHVDDLEKSKDFYVDTLGFAERDVPAGPGVAPLQGEGISPVLIEVENVTKPDYPNATRVIFGVETDDIQATFSEYKAKGVQLFENEPEPFPVGQIAHFHDPAGNVLELIQWS